MNEYLKDLGKASLSILVLGTVIYGTVTALELIDRKWVKPALKKVGDGTEAKAKVNNVVNDVKEAAEKVATDVTNAVNSETPGAAANG